MIQTASRPKVASSSRRKLGGVVLGHEVHLEGGLGDASQAELMRCPRLVVEVAAHAPGHVVVGIQSWPSTDAGPAAARRPVPTRGAGHGRDDGQVRRISPFWPSVVTVEGCWSGGCRGGCGRRRRRTCRWWRPGGCSLVVAAGSGWRAGNRGRVRVLSLDAEHAGIGGAVVVVHQCQLVVFCWWWLLPLVLGVGTAVWLG